MEGERLEFETRQLDRQRYQVMRGEESFELELAGDRVRWQGHELPLSLESMEGRRVRLRLGGELYTAEVERRQRTQAAGRGPFVPGHRGTAGGHAVEAPMPGMVVCVEVEEGQEVVPGQVLLILEAMKMENELRAPASGRVTRVAVTAGDNVNGGDVLVVLE